MIGRSRWRTSRGRAPNLGSATVEMVLLVPAMMLIFFVIIQFALWAHAAQVTQLAASEGDRVARSQGGGAVAGIAQAEAVTREPDSGLANAAVNAEMLPGDVVRVTVSGSAVSIIPGLTLPVSAAQSGPIQEFRESG
ncbi:MAG: TadE family protein [Acidimicrobiales bacterium]